MKQKKITKLDAWLNLNKKNCKINKNSVWNLGFIDKVDKKQNMHYFKINPNFSFFKRYSIKVFNAEMFRRTRNDLYYILLEN